MREKRNIGSRTGILIVTALIILASLVAYALEPTYFKGHTNGRVEGFDKTDVSMFRVQPMDSRYYTEAYFHEFQFEEQGIILIVNFQMHNLGFSRGYCDTYITFSDATSGLVVEKNEYSPDEVKIDEQGFGISAGPSRIELKGNQYHVKYRGEQMQADLTYDILAPSFIQGDGKLVFDDNDFVRFNFPIPWAKVTGTLTREGKTYQLDGVGSMNHDWQVLSPLKFMSDWRAFWMYGDDATIGIVMCSSSDMEGRWLQRLMVAERGKILFSSHDFKYEELEMKPVPGGNVPCPKRFKIEAVHGDDSLTGEMTITSIREKKDVLDDTPLLMRKLASVFVDETWSYRFWMDFDFEYQSDGRTRQIKGRGTGNYVDSTISE